MSETYNILDSTLIEVKDYKTESKEKSIFEYKFIRVKFNIEVIYQGKNSNNKKYGWRFHIDDNHYNDETSEKI